MKPDPDNFWRTALALLDEIEEHWYDLPLRAQLLAACREWISAQEHLPRLRALARILKPDITLRQLWSVRVPVERSVARLKITDVEILSDDLPTHAAPLAPPIPLTLIVDSLRSAFNVGGILRTAECFGANEVILCGYTPLPDQAQVARAALGSDKLIAWHYLPDVREAIATQQTQGTPCIALETVASAPTVAEFRWPTPCALVIGNERFGLAVDIIKLCAHTVRIALAGRKNSLNVVAALAVALYAARQSIAPTP